MLAKKINNSKISSYDGRTIGPSKGDNQDYLKGIVGIGYMCGSKRRMTGSTNGRQHLWYICRMNAVQPFRTTSVHFCYDNPMWKLTFALIQTTLGSQARMRTRPHYGTHIEIVYELMTFGIVPDMLPFDEEDEGSSAFGNVSTRNHHVFLEQLRHEEEEARYVGVRGTVDGSSGAKVRPRPSSILADDHQVAPARAVSSLSAVSDLHQQGVQNSVEIDSKKIEHPTEYDALLGRGPTRRNHSGNHRLHALIDQCADKYNNASSKFDKTVIAETVVQQIKKGVDGSSRGRFLRSKKNSRYLEVATDEYARSSVSHAFRNRRLASKKQAGAQLKTTTHNSSLLSIGSAAYHQQSSGVVGTSTKDNDSNGFYDNNSDSCFARCFKSHKFS